MVRNCYTVQKADIKSIVITAALLLLFYGSRYVLKKKLSPIWLIILSAGIGAAVF